MKKLFLSAAGIILVIVGVVGLFLPVIQGLAFIFLGLSLVAPRLAERWKRRLWMKFSKKDVWIIEQWDRYPVRAGLTTRHFPLVLKSAADLDRDENRGRFENLFNENHVVRAHGAAGQHSFVYMDQAHEDTIAVLDDPEPYAKPGFYRLESTDAVLTDIPGLTLLVMTADCLPIYFYTAWKSASLSLPRWAGLAHAGWRGTQRGIAEKTFRMLLDRSGADRSEVRVVFGPRICGRCYQVGPEFKGFFHRKSIRTRGGRVYFDLAAENRRRLLQAGLPERNLIDLAVCSVEDSRDFYSFRREREGAGRMVSFVVNMVK